MEKIVLKNYRNKFSPIRTKFEFLPAESEQK